MIIETLVPTNKLMHLNLKLDTLEVNVIKHFLACLHQYSKLCYSENDRYVDVIQSEFIFLQKWLEKHIQIITGCFRLLYFPGTPLEGPFGYCIQILGWSFKHPSRWVFFSFFETMKATSEKLKVEECWNILRPWRQ